LLLLLLGRIEPPEDGFWDFALKDEEKKSLQPQQYQPKE
jgi:hypothetical protein